MVVLDTGLNSNIQGPDFDDMSSFFPCEIDDAIQYTLLILDMELQN